MFLQKKNHCERFLKIILVFLFLLITIALITTWNTPATSYESSIYHSTPLLLWVSVVTSEMIGAGLVVFSVDKNELKERYLWKVGLLLIVLSYLICLSLFIIRGYYMWCMTGDPASHIGWIKETLNTGQVPSSIIYPITHIYISDIILFTGLDLIFLHKIVPWIFGLLCVLFMYILTRYITSNRIAPVLAVIISCSFLFGWYLNLTPNALSNMFFPLVLLLIFKSIRKNDFRWGILLLMMILLYPVFHILPAIFIGLVFLTLCIPRNLSKLRNIMLKRQIFFWKKWKRVNFRLVIPFIILIIWLILWISMFSEWKYTIRSIYNAISIEGSPSKGLYLMDQITYASGYGYNIFEIIFKQLGAPFIVFILAILAFPLLWKKFFNEQKDGALFSLYGPLGFLCMFIPALYFFNLGFGPLRLLFYVTMIGVILSGYFLSYFLIQSQNNNKTQLRPWPSKIIVIALLLCLFLGGMLNLYPSPYNLTINYQTTRTEVVGMEFFFQNREINIPLTGIFAAPGRFADILLTPNEKLLQNLPRYLEDNKVPWHFGYDRYTSLAQSFDRDTNLIITLREKKTYIDYFPEIAKYRFYNEDFIRLTIDDGINLLYSNGGFTLWSISGNKWNAL